MKTFYTTKSSLLTLIATTTLFAQCQAKESKSTEPTQKVVINIDKTSGTKADDMATTLHKYETKASKTDSIAFEKYISDAKKYYATLTNNAADERRQRLILHIAREFIGIPYVAKTLENNDYERLVVNLRELDCTTYVENVLAIYLCIKNEKTEYADYISYLRQIRYIDGNVSYENRQHYFTEWIYQNTRKNITYEINKPNPPFSATQNLSINYMSTHSEAYPLLKSNPQLIKPIAEMEKRISCKTYDYIPKTKLTNSKLLRSTIHDGDIIAITTNKKGLDTSHIGIAVWHKDGLHMLNASQIHKKVVEEPMTLYQYMQKHPSQMGVRIVRIK